jgi:hypothetical protein
MSEGKRDRVLLVGLDQPEYLALRERIDKPVVYADLLPRLQLDAGRLLVEKPDSFDVFTPVSRVVFHGIFEDDLPFLTALALWGGPCLPNARGMMDCRQRIPCLVRALQVTRFGSMPRSYAERGTTVERAAETVAKWGEWHCGENKARFRGPWKCEVPTLLEPFIEGEAVRVHLLGDRSWQIRMTGSDWLKSIHGNGAAFMAPDPELVEDARKLQRHFQLEMMAVDYMVAADGGKHLLEVNHIPNVTIFPELREAYLDFAAEWLRRWGVVEAARE